MGLLSADFWHTVKDLSTVVLGLLLLYQIRASRSQRKRTTGFLGGATSSSKKGEGLRTTLRGFAARFSKVRGDSPKEALSSPKGKEMRCESPQDAILWGADPYMLAVRMASEGIALNEIARRTEIPRGEVMLAVRFRSALENEGRVISGPSNVEI